MRFEHKLSPALAAYAQQQLAQFREQRQAYMAALGAVKEAELELLSTQRAVGQLAELVRQMDKLPPVVAGAYQLNAEGTALIGDIAEPTAEADRAAKPLWPKMTNGSGAVIEMAREDAEDAG
jgi:hypothetical protein